jgi:hypothetical protein
MKKIFFCIAFAIITGVAVVNLTIGNFKSSDNTISVKTSMALSGESDQKARTRCVSDGDNVIMNVNGLSLTCTTEKVTCEGIGTQDCTDAIIVKDCTPSS